MDHVASLEQLGDMDAGKGNNGVFVIDFIVSHDLVTLNSYFEIIDEHSIFL